MGARTGVPNAKQSTGSSSNSTTSLPSSSGEPLNRHRSAFDGQARPVELRAPEKAQAVAELLRSALGSDKTDKTDTTDKTPIDPEPQREAPEGRVAEPATEQAQEDDGDQRSAPGLGDSKALGDVAKALGIKPKDLYAIEVPLGDDDGTVMSLGELKDYAKAARGSEAEHAGAREKIASREATLAKDRELVALTLQEMGQQVRLSPQLQAKLERQSAEHDARQRNMMLAVMPELGDQAELGRFRGDVVDRMRAFSYEPHELDYRDYRALWFTKTAFGWKDELDKLKGLKPRSKETRQTPAMGKAPQVDKTKQLIAGARGGNVTDKTRAISALLAKQRKG